MMKNTKLALFFFFKKLISAPLALLNSCCYSAIRYRQKKDTEFFKKNITDTDRKIGTVMKTVPNIMKTWTIPSSIYSGLFYLNFKILKTVKFSHADYPAEVRYLNAHQKYPSAYCHNVWRYIVKGTRLLL